MTFKKGESGNPHGRPPGTSQAKKLREAIADDLPDILESMVKAAKGGDVGAAKLLLDRCIPSLKPQQETVAVDGLQGTTTQQANAIVSAMADGQLSPDQSQAMLAGLASLMKIVEIDDLEKRLAALEERQ